MKAITVKQGKKQTLIDAISNDIINRVYKIQKNVASQGVTGTIYLNYTGVTLKEWDNLLSVIKLSGIWLIFENVIILNPNDECRDELKVNLQIN